MMWEKGVYLPRRRGLHIPYRLCSVWLYDSALKSRGKTETRRVTSG
jgi:hypothetical protein